MPSIVDKSSVKKVCVDDFALRKRFSYGTVMVDLESHKIIDLIPTRNTNEVKEWLSKYPNIEVISRDGAQLYANAAERSHPGIIQVSDRFHIIKGLTEAVTKYMIRTFPARIEIPAVSVETDEIENRAIVKEEKHLLAMKQKQNEVNEARALAKKGVPIEEIAKSLHHTYKTIQRYLSAEYSVENGHYNARIPGKLAPYETEVIKLRSEGMTYPNIHKIITQKGYKGSVASLRMFIQKERIRNQAHLSLQESCSDYQPKEYIQRRSLTPLIYKGLSDVKTITKTQYEQVLKTYPVIAELYTAIKEFYEILYSRQDERLETWLEKIENFNIPELQTYVNGIRIDINAVKNGIKLKYNNGFAEGSVNKIKVIKRIMYGRNSFDLLKAKVLLHEQFCCEFN